MSIPKRYKKFTEDYHETAATYMYPGSDVRKWGSLDEKISALIKAAVSTSARLIEALHSYVRKALTASAAPDKIKYAVMLSLPAAGLPSMMAALSRADDIFKENT